MQFIEPSKQYADIVIPASGGKTVLAINMLKAQILSFINPKPVNHASLRYRYRTLSR